MMKNQKQNEGIILTGIVQRGHGRGKDTGARTANLPLVLGKHVPKKGLYTSTVIIGKREYAGLLYYGYNMLTGKDCLEVHLFNFSKELYQKKIVVIVGKFLRPPKKFKTIQALQKQIQKDLTQAE